MILFKTAEKLVTAQSGGEFRAQTVAYTLGWLFEKSGRRIDLGKIWEKQCVPSVLADAITVVCKAAYKHIKGKEGNPSEAAKKEECWTKFKNTKITLDSAWEKCWADHAIVAAVSEEDALRLEWDRVRQKFLTDSRTVYGLAARLGKQSVTSVEMKKLSQLAGLKWNLLKMEPGLGPKKLRQLVELFSAAAENM